MAWQPQLWAGSTRGTNLCVWPRHWCLASPVWAYRSCFLLEICLDLVKAALLGSRLDTGAARVQASVADQTWRGLTSRLALWQSPGTVASWRLYLKTAGLEWVGLSFESLQMANPNVRQSPRRGDDLCFPQSSESKWRETAMWQTGAIFDHSSTIFS